MDQTQNPQTLPNKIEEWLFGVAAKKAAWAVAKFITAIIMSVVVQRVLARYGVHIDPQTLTPGVAAGIMAGLEFAHDYLKVKFPNLGLF